MPLESTRAARLASGLTAAAIGLAAPPAALAAGTVYGGSTTAGEPIVVVADAKATKLKSMVVSWEAKCDDGAIFPVAMELRAVTAQPGFSPAASDLMTSRNGKGRFAGTQLGGRDLGELAAAVSAKVSGKLRRSRASGTLSADVTIVDKASGETRATCRTGTVRWSTSSARGRIFGGKTSQDEPVVVRVDAARRRVSDVLIGWGTRSCEPPDRYLRFGERFTAFPIRARRFGDAFEQSFAMDGGGRITYAYDMGGTLARRTARGTLRVRVTARDAAGATVFSCDSGGVSWSAASS